MKRIVKNVLGTIAVFVTQASLVSAAEQLEQTSENSLWSVYQSIQSGRSASSKLTYIMLFPKTKEGFIKKFGYSEEEEDDVHKHKYELLDFLFSLRNDFPDEVMNIYISLASELEWEADAVSILQLDFARNSAENSCLFAKKIELLPSNKRHKAITFLTNVESFGAFDEYFVLLNGLKECGCQSLIIELEKNRVQRQSRNHN